MTFLIDNQLPQALAHFLVSRGYSAKHVLEIGLDEAKDKFIWQYAVENHCVIVTKDEDFLALSLHHNGQAQIVWARIGNCRKQTLLAAFETALPKLMQAIQQGDRVIELR